MGARYDPSTARKAEEFLARYIKTAEPVLSAAIVPEKTTQITARPLDSPQFDDVRD